jgi:hypothetical protein
MLQCGWILKILYSVKKSNHKRPCIMILFKTNVQNKWRGKSTETRLVLPMAGGSQGRENWGVMVNWHRIYEW